MLNVKHNTFQFSFKFLKVNCTRKEFPTTQINHRHTTLIVLRKTMVYRKLLNKLKKNKTKEV